MREGKQRDSLCLPLPTLGRLASSYVASVPGLGQRPAKQAANERSDVSILIARVIVAMAGDIELCHAGA